MDKIDAGCYKLTITKANGKKTEYVVLISGYRPFLNIETIWSVKDNIIVSNDILRGVNVTYDKII